MSLKVFHIVFVVCSTALAVGFGVWCLAHREAGAFYGGAGLLSFGAAGVLLVYGARFWRRIQDTRFS